MTWRSPSQGKWDVFRTCGRDDQQGEVAAKVIADRFKGRTIAVPYNKTTYDKGPRTPPWRRWASPA